MVPFKKQIFFRENLDDFWHIRIDDHAPTQVYTALKIAKESFVVFKRVKSDDSLISIPFVNDFDIFNLNKLIEKVFEVSKFYFRVQICQDACILDDLFISLFHW